MACLILPGVEAVPTSSQQLPSWTWEEGSPGSLPALMGLWCPQVHLPSFDGIKAVWKGFISPKESQPGQPLADNPVPALGTNILLE